MKLITDNSFLMVIDVQEKIFATMHEQVDTEQNINRIIDGSKVLGLPIVWTEQYPKGLGPTILSVRENLEGFDHQEKLFFSCFGDETIKESIGTLKRNQALLCGIETHVCVYQTARDLLGDDYDVHIVTDAVMSRKESNYHLALDKLRNIGAWLTSVEMALFELQQTAKGETFKAISQIIK